MKTKTILSDTVVALVLVAFVLPAPAYCAGRPDLERITAEGEGEAEIQDQDLSRARREALEDGLQKAFENALVEILPLAHSLAGRHDVLDQLAPSLKRYLLQYRVLSEMPALQVFFLNVEATFSVPLIREDLVKIGIAWTEEGTGEPIELFVRIEGISSFLWYQRLLQVFQKMPHVRTATTFEVFGTAMVLRLEYERDLDDLLDMISSCGSEEFSLRVEQVEDREIKVSLETMGN
jgi:hypothetical protein